MQYFLGYSSFISEKPFDASLFVDIRKRLGIETINAINEKIISLKTKMEEKRLPPKTDSGISPIEPAAGGASIEAAGEAPIEPTEDGGDMSEISALPISESAKKIEHKGKVIFDATACPQEAYPTDLDLLSEARQITERLIDELYAPELHGEKNQEHIGK
jgi:hypothetical protein